MKKHFIAILAASAIAAPVFAAPGDPTFEGDVNTKVKAGKIKNGTKGLSAGASVDIMGKGGSGNFAQAAATGTTNFGVIQAGGGVFKGKVNVDVEADKIKNQAGVLNFGVMQTGGKAE